MVLKNTDWLPSRMSDQAAMFSNVLLKIAGVAPDLPLTPAQVAKIESICTQFNACYNYVLASRATTESLVEWRENAFYGQPIGSALPKVPGFDILTLEEDWSIGIIPQFREMVDLIKASPGYNHSIGEDLMIVGSTPEPPPPSEVTPSLKVNVETGYKVNTVGSMQGADAIRFEYQRKGTSEWLNVGFLTKMPGQLQIAPLADGQAEIGNLRAQFVKKNQPYGNWSPSYSVTLS